MSRTPLTAMLGILAVTTTAPAVAQRCDPKPAPNYAPLASDDAVTKKAKAIHSKVMTLDTHVDINSGLFRADTTNYCNRIGTQVDLTKMEEGGLDAVFFSIYVGQQARGAGQDSAGYARAYTTDTTLFNAVHRLAERLAPERIAIAYTAADAKKIYASGKKVAFMGVENAYGIGTDITRVKEFHDRGARYMSLSHNNPSQLSDSNTGEGDGFWMYGDGMSPLGKDVIREMNKWGIMVDISHPSRGSMKQALEITRAPIIASHSGVRAICNHSRNLDDDQLRALAKNGGVIQVVAFRNYTKCDPRTDSLRRQATAELRTEFGLPPVAGRGGRGAGGGGGGGRGAGGRGAAPVDSALMALPEERRNAYNSKMAEIATKYPQAAPATVKDFVDHIDHAVKLMGIDHVGISSDFDGGGGVEGFNSALEGINVTTELVRRGYTEEQIAKIWSGNLLRVLEQTEKVAKQIQAETRPRS